MTFLIFIGAHPIYGNPLKWGPGAGASSSESLGGWLALLTLGYTGRSRQSNPKPYPRRSQRNQVVDHGQVLGDSGYF